MALYDPELNAFVIEETDRQVFVMPEDVGAASV